MTDRLIFHRSVYSDQLAMEWLAHAFRTLGLKVEMTNEQIVVEGDPATIRKCALVARDTMGWKPVGQMGEA